MKFSQIFIGILILFAALGCRKEEDENPPIVTIELPYENSIVEVGDYVRVKASIRDDQNIESVKLSLIDADSKLPTGGTQHFQPNASTYELDHNFHLSDSQMESGSYYFEVEAKDKENFGAAFRTISVNQKPKVLKGMILAIKEGATSRLKKLAVNGSNLTDVLLLNIPLKSVVLNQLYQHYWVIPKGNYPAKVIDLAQKAEVFSIQPPQSQQTGAFSEMVLDQNQVFIADYSGVLNAYNASFSDQFTYSSDGQNYVETFDVFNDRLFVVEKDQTFTGSVVRSVYRVSGGVISSVNVAKDIQKIHVLDGQNALIFWNDAGDLKISELYMGNGAVSNYKSILNETIIDVVSLPNNNYVLATNHGLYRFDYRWNNIYTIMKGSVNSIDYDQGLNELLVAHNDSLSRFSATGFQLTQSYFFPGEEIVDAKYWYNR